MADQRTQPRWRVAMLALAMLAAGCASPSDTTTGAELFSRESLGGVEGCSTCHRVDRQPSVGGPTLQGIGRWGATRVEGVSAPNFIRESILTPNAAFAYGWGEGMPSYAEILTADELDAIVDYLASLR